MSSNNVEQAAITKATLPQCVRQLAKPDSVAFLAESLHAAQSNEHGKTNRIAVTIYKGSALSTGQY
jgi:hypothetical protein